MLFSQKYTTNSHYYNHYINTSTKFFSFKYFQNNQFFNNMKLYIVIDV